MRSNGRCDRLLMILVISLGGYTALASMAVSYEGARTRNVGRKDREEY